jgi:hypothetical protein
MAQGDPLRRAIQDYRDEDEDWEELTPVLTEAVQAALQHDRDSHPESDHPMSGFAVAWGSANLGAHGRVAWLVAVLVAVVALASLATRARPPTPAPTISAPAVHS